MSIFYYLFLIVVKAPLGIENHIGFLLWSAIPALLLSLFSFKKMFVGFFMVLIGMISAYSSLIVEMLASQKKGIGTLGLF